MKKLILILGLILLIIPKSIFAQDAALAEVSGDAEPSNVATASGYVFLEIMEPPKIGQVSARHLGFTGFSIKQLENKFASTDKNALLHASALLLLTMLIVFNVYQSLRYLREQKSII